VSGADRFGWAAVVSAVAGAVAIMVGHMIYGSWAADAVGLCVVYLYVRSNMRPNVKHE